ncbi:hypothetical protein [Methylobacterium segetis]|uniref:hypothetical protein n=1 Tax=Methylobacterium segetis TaxID=2488750 RepID=UPI001045BA8A|nr:hypothetical protein [Methylobacterium segetis]
MMRLADRIQFLRTLFQSAEGEPIFGGVYRRIRVEREVFATSTERSTLNTGINFAMQPQNERATRVQMLRAKLDDAIPYDLRPLWREFLVALDAEAIETREARAGEEEHRQGADEARQDARASASGACCE